MRVYRIFDHAYRASAMTGEGAARTGGRWNSPGVPMIYASETLSLALLEVMVNARRTTPAGKLFVEANIPNSLRVERVRLRDLPSNWVAYPPSGRLARLGDAWARGRKTVALIVPSAIVPSERNVLLNPAHPDFARIHMGQATPLRVDPRLR